MLGDPEQEYFADGLTDEIITALCYVPWLFVIARDSSFSFKNQLIDVRQICKELGVRYVLEGSVRRDGNRLRIIGQLVDSESMTNIWAERFEAEFGDMFDLQDEITEAVVTAIGSTIEAAEIARAVRKRPDSLTAYDRFLQAKAALNGFRIDAAIEILDNTIVDAPNYAKAKAVRAWCATLIGWHSAAPSENEREFSLQLAEEALQSPNCDPETQAYAGYTIGFMSEQGDRAISLLEDVTRQCPSFDWAWAALALLESYHGDAKRAIKLAESALRLNPRGPQSFRCEMAIAKACFRLGQDEDAVAYAELGLQKSPANAFFHMCRIASLLRLDKVGEAKAATQEFRRRDPAFRSSKWFGPARNWRAWRELIPVLEGAMRKVSVPY